MASKIPTKPKKSLSPSVWVLILWYQHHESEVVNIKSEHASRGGAASAALTKVNRFIERFYEESGTEGKIYIRKDWPDRLQPGSRDWFHIQEPRREDQWLSAGSPSGYRFEKHEVINDVIDEGNGLESTVWIQRLRNNDLNLRHVTFYDFEGVYESERLAIAARSPDVTDENYELRSYQIQE